jgi:hypothetical protein
MYWRPDTLATLTARSIRQSKNAIASRACHHFSDAFPLESVPEVKRNWPSGVIIRKVRESPVEAGVP